MTKYPILLSPFEGKLKLKNKVVMAPMTRSRATSDNIPTDIMSTYYGERAQSAGLIITEGTSPSPNGVGYPRIPALYNEEQIAAWKKVTESVHQNGGKIFAQLMHTGRVSHPDNMPSGSEILAPSAITPANTKMYVDGKGELEIPVPKEMTNDDIEHVISEFVNAAKNAIEAGFDGVEIHAANGYLLEQFLNPKANQRTDAYGGNEENRSRLVLEISEQTVEAIGANRVGIRLSPNGALNDLGPYDGQDVTFNYLTNKLNQLGIAYIHLVNHESMGAPALPASIRENIRDKFDGILILSGGYDPETAENDLKDNKGDLIAFGRPFIANPDLVNRWVKAADLNEPDMTLLYTPGEKGYTDYTVLDKTVR